MNQIPVLRRCLTPEPLFSSQSGHIYSLCSGRLRLLTQTPLQPGPDSPNFSRRQKYLRVQGKWHGNKYDYYVYRLMVVWLPETTNLSPCALRRYQVHHLNGVLANNEASNLICLSPATHRRFDAALAQGLVLTRKSLC